MTTLKRRAAPWKLLNMPYYPKFSNKHQEQMLKLIRKCSDCKNLNKALQKMGLKKAAQTRLLNRFRKLGISPVTLCNDSRIDSLPGLHKLKSIVFDRLEGHKNESKRIR